MVFIDVATPAGFTAILRNMPKCVYATLDREDGIHTLLLEDAPASDVKVKKLRRTRVPTIRPLILTWKIPVSYFKRFSSQALANVKQLTFGNRFNDKIDDAAWLSSLQRLTFGHDFNQAVDVVV